MSNEIKSGDTWEGRAKSNTGREVVITAYDPTMKIVQIHEHGARSPKRTMHEDSLRSNWRPKGSQPRPRKTAASEVAAMPAPTNIQLEELELKRRLVTAVELIAVGIRELGAAWSSGAASK